MFQVDQLFKAEVDVTDLVRAGFATSRDVDGNLLDTNVISVDFGKPTDVIRAWADLLTFTARNDPSTAKDEKLESLSRIIGDVTLQQKPAGVAVCFRGKKQADTPPVAPNFCDETPKPNEGAFQVQGRTFATNVHDRLDVDAFVRFARGGGTDVMSATTHIDNIPLVVQGTFSDDGKIDVGGFAGDAKTPKGIDGIGFEMANFDLHENAHGYKGNNAQGVANQRWGDSYPGFPGGYLRNRLSDHFARINVLDDLFFVQGKLGVIDDPDSNGTPDNADSNLQRVFLSSNPCPFPQPNQKPDDYPHFPADGSKYSCLRTEFEQVLGGSTKPLLLELTVDKGRDHLALNQFIDQADHSKGMTQAGLSRIPAFMQMTMAKSNVTDENGAFRKPCGAHGDHPDNFVGCMPPLIRLDLGAAAGDPALFGVLEIGHRGDIEVLREAGSTIPILLGLTFPAEPGKLEFGQIPGPAAGMTDPPGVDGWQDWKSHNGARIKVGSFKETVENNLEERTAVVGGIHLPIPRSLTVDQFQSWSCVSGTTDCGTSSSPPDDADQESNKDMRLHYIARDENGVTTDSLGQLAVMLRDEKGKQTYLDTELPGEMGMALYGRGKWDSQKDEKKFGTKFIQLDGRFSKSVPITIRILDDAGDGGIGLLNLIAHGYPAVPAGDTDPQKPSFRLRAQIMNNKAVDSSTVLGFSCVVPVLVCTNSNVEVNEVKADIDFLNAKRIDAAVSVEGARNGIELRGYSDLEGKSNPAPVTTKANIEIDPMTVFIHLGIPVVFGAEILLSTQIFAHLSATTATEFSFRNHLLKMKARHKGSAGEVKVDPDLYPYVAFGVASVVLIFFNAVWGFVYAWLPTVGPQLMLNFMSCPIGVPHIGSFTVDKNSTEEYWVDAGLDPRFVAYGTEFLRSWVMRLLGVTGLAHGFLTLGSMVVGCLLDDADKVPLIENDPDDMPGPPVSIKFHPVPDKWGDDTAVAAPPIPPDPKPVDHDVVGAQTFCGDHLFGAFKVKDNATLTVGSAQSAHCSGKPEDVGRLNLTAGSITVEERGTLDATTATKETQLTADTITIARDNVDANIKGTIKAGTNIVNLAASNLLQIDGQILADKVSDATSVNGSPSATGNSGAGHGVDGGNGSTGVGGKAFGDTSFAPDANSGLVSTEVGAKGAAVTGTAGRGGGRLYLVGGKVRISGIVSANGEKGSDGSTAATDCARPDDGDPDNGDQSKANTGTRGAGGGSGGAIFISAAVIDVSGGTLSAVGGAGGRGNGGGGGGGAGGRVKVAAPIYKGNAVQRGGGAGGFSACNDAGHTSGAAGGAGPDIKDDSPISMASVPEGPFWHRGKADGTYKLQIPFKGAAKPATGNAGFHVKVCGLYRPPEAKVPPAGADPTSTDSSTPKSAEADFGIDMPAASTQSVTNPCGTDTGDTKVNQLGTTHVPTEESASKAALVVTHESGPNNIATNAGDGYWGVFTIVAKPGDVNNNCFARDVSIPGFVNATQYDQLNCRYEVLPAKADTVIGIDNDVPEGKLQAPDKSSTRSIDLIISEVSDAMPWKSDATKSVDPQSGIDKILCSNNDGDEKSCGTGTVSWELPNVSKEHKVSVRIIDLAGNVHRIDHNVTLDVTPPNATTKAVPEETSLPPAENGWYRTSPHFELSGFTDPTGPDPTAKPSGPGATPYAFWFDGGTRQSCTPGTSGTSCVCPTGNPNPVCTVTTGLPGTGTHTFHAVAIDAAGHEKELNSITFKVDGEKPLAALLTAPFGPDGNNSWFTERPFGVVSALDQPGGSGLEDGDGPAGVYLSTDNGATWKLQKSNDELLPAGSYSACVKAIDVAGNVSDVTCRQINVDVALPVLSYATTTPVTPDGGLNQWVKQKPTVTVSATDDGAIANDTTGLCDPQLTTSAPPQPSGICVSYDGGPFRPTYAGALLDEGKHNVRAFAVDRAGKRSVLRVADPKYRSLGALEVKVDLTDPLPYVRTQAPKPALADRYRAFPMVVLRGTDPAGNSGVQSVKYTLDGVGPTDYRGPFLIKTDGTHTLTVSVTDSAGRVGTSTRTIIVDTTPPVLTAGTPAPTPQPFWCRPITGHVPNPLKCANQPTFTSATLPYTAVDDGSTSLTASVIIYGIVQAAEGVRVIRRLDVPTLALGSLSFSISWDGRLTKCLGSSCSLVEAPNALQGAGQPGMGRYWYRVVATDQAGNAAMSSDSAKYIELAQ